MAYTRGDSAQIIVGAAAFFVSKVANATAPAFVGGTDYKTTVSADDVNWRNVGYTSNGLELMFEPDFGEVKVDQLLDVAKLFKQGMKVSLKTSFAEATLENLLLAIAQKDSDLAEHSETISTAPTVVGSEVDIKSGELGEYPLERQIIAIGASEEVSSLGENSAATASQRVYNAYRALSIESVTVSAKRDEATMFEVNFRLLPDENGVYGKIVDRTYVA
jgi:hypothetical protein